MLTQWKHWHKAAVNTLEAKRYSLRPGVKYLATYSNLDCFVYNNLKQDSYVTLHATLLRFLKETLLGALSELFLLQFPHTLFPALLKRKSVDMLLQDA